MKTFVKLIEQMDDEACGALEYAECYHKMKKEDPALASIYHDMSRTEMQHYDMLDKQLHKVADEHHLDKEATKAMTDWTESKMGKKVDKAKSILEKRD